MRNFLPINKFSNAIFKIVTLVSLTLSTVSLYAQTIVDPANLVFEITLPSDNSIELSSNQVNNEDNLALTRSVVRYQDSINAIQLASNSPYNFELLEEYDALGDAYKSLGQHQEAILHYDNAIQITKIQNGLHNLEQLPLVQKIIQSHIKMGDTENADIWQEYSYYLHLANYEATEPEMVQATFDLAEWNIVSYFKMNLQSPDRKLRITNRVINPRQRLTNELNQNQTLLEDVEESPGNGMMEAIFNGQIVGMTPRDVEDPLILRINTIYNDLQDQIYADEVPDLAIVVQMARRIAELSYITRQEMEFEKHNAMFSRNYSGSRQEAYRNSQYRLDRSYTSGESALQFVINLLKTVEASPSILATSLIELADWQFAYGKIVNAETTYREIYELMASTGNSSRAVDASLNKAIPQQIPRLATHMFTRESAGYDVDTPLDFKGYIDVSYLLDDHGNASEIIFSESTQEDARLIQRFIESSLEVSKFRPILRDGEFLSPGRVELRYYYAY